MMGKFKKVTCLPCKGTGKLLYPNTGIENDCYHCNGFGVTMEQVSNSSPTGEGE